MREHIERIRNGGDEGTGEVRVSWGLCMCVCVCDDDHGVCVFVCDRICQLTASGMETGEGGALNQYHRNEITDTRTRTPKNEKETGRFLVWSFVCYTDIKLIETYHRGKCGGGGVEVARIQCGEMSLKIGQSGWWWDENTVFGWKNGQQMYKSFHSWRKKGVVSHRRGIRRIRTTHLQPPGIELSQQGLFFYKKRKEIHFREERTKEIRKKKHLFYPNG